MLAEEYKERGRPCRNYSPAVPNDRRATCFVAVIDDRSRVPARCEFGKRARSVETS